MPLSGLQGAGYGSAADVGRFPEAVRLPSGAGGDVCRRDAA